MECRFFIPLLCCETTRVVFLHKMIKVIVLICFSDFWEGHLGHLMPAGWIPIFMSRCYLMSFDGFISAFIFLCYTCVFYSDVIFIVTPSSCVLLKRVLFWRYVYYYYISLHWKINAFSFFFCYVLSLSVHVLISFWSPTFIPISLLLYLFFPRFSSLPRLLVVALLYYSI